MTKAILHLIALLGLASVGLAQPQPAGADLMRLDEIRAGMRGEVWTVFHGTRPEPFAVEVVGVIRNALGPGKNIILCKLTDPRVQKMGAGAGMSGSPLYIDGRLAGALSYQLQRFETVPHAGFTPIEDLMEVSRLPTPAADSFPAPLPLRSTQSGGAAPAAERAVSTAALDSPFQPLTPVFTLSGTDPEVAEIFGSAFRALGLAVANAGGSYGFQASPASTMDAGTPAAGPRFPRNLRPGDAISVALATGDITIAGTGTVSRVDGTHLLAFGHPLMHLGAVDLPMASSEIITILPSLMSSSKVANIGPVIGTISQDRLSAVYGEMGRLPEMIPVTVTVPNRGATRTLHFSVVRQAQIAPLVAATGLTQGILGSNDAGLAQGFRVRRRVTFPGGRTVSADNLYAGPQGFTAGVGEFVHELADWLQNPFEKVFPSNVAFSVEALGHNPLAILEVAQLSRASAAPGDKVQLTLTWRDYQEVRSTQVVTLPVDPAWAGKSLEVVVTTGPQLDELSGFPQRMQAAQIRSFDDYLSALEDNRRTDGLYVAVMEKAAVFLDQSRPTVDYPASLARIARQADEQRYQREDAMVPLWEQHLLEGRLIQAEVRRPLKITE
jgi:SpoIVB peptidase S55